MTVVERMKEIRDKHPYPWQERWHPNGLVQLIDANGNEVSLKDITTFCTIVTATMWNATQATTKAAEEAKAA